MSVLQLRKRSDSKEPQNINDMPNLNKVIIAGHLTRDPELRYTPGGTAVANIGIAMTHKWKGADGQQREDTCFIDVTAFGKQAEVLAQWLKKGAPLLVEGRLKLDQWDDKATGQKRSKHGIVLESFSFLGGKDSGQSQQPRTRQAPQEQEPLEVDSPGADDLGF